MEPFIPNSSQEPLSTYAHISKQESTLWQESWTPTCTPSITQLAHHRARKLDLTSVSDQPTPHLEILSEGDGEKQQDDSKTPSSNTSGIFKELSIPDIIQPSMTGTREIAFIFITCISQFLSLSALNQTVAPCLVLADYFHVEDYGTLSWFSASFSMSVGTFILPAGTSEST
jgi:hypothetical protein